MRLAREEGPRGEESPFLAAPLTGYPPRHPLSHRLLLCFVAFVQGFRSSQWAAVCGGGAGRCLSPRVSFPLLDPPPPPGGKGTPCLLSPGPLGRLFPWL